MARALVATLLGACVLLPSIAAAADPYRRSSSVRLTEPDPRDPASANRKAPDEVRHYAPMLWLSPDEITFPMLPHAFAFDGIDNDGDGCFDVEDPDEVEVDWFDVIQASRQRRKAEVELAASKGTESIGDRPPSAAYPRGEGLPPCTPPPPPFDCREHPSVPRDNDGRPTCWTTAGPPWGTGQPVAPQARVLYSDEETFAGSLQGLPPVRVEDRLRPFAARAAGEARKRNISRDGQLVGPPHLRKRLNRDQRIDLYQYWFYYPIDDGPNSHKDDDEHIAVFVEDLSGHRSIKAFVGVGHEQDNVNDILVRGTLKSEALFPKELWPHTPVLIELGKHASALDRNCNGRFDLGFDANLYPEAVWGSRDVWAGNVGQALKVGTFRPWYSFPRTVRNTLYVEQDSWEDNRAEYSEPCRGFDSPIPGELESSSLTPPKAYSLFPISLMKWLAETIEYACLSEGCNPKRIQALLRTYSRLFWVNRDPHPLEVSQAAAERMWDWVKPSPTLALREPWRHEAFGRPNDDFREWLFNRMGLGITTKADGGNWVTGLSLRISEVRLPKTILGIVKLPGRIGGSQALHDSRLEAYAHWDGINGSEVTPCGQGKHCLYDVGVDLFSGRARFAGKYAGVTWNRDYNAAAWYQHLGLSAGVEFGIPAVHRTFNVMGMAGISAQLFRPRVKDLPDAAGPREPLALRAQIGLRVTKTFWPPHHPLSY